MEEADEIPHQLLSLEAEHKAECQVPLCGDLCRAGKSESGAAPCCGWEGVAVDIRYGSDHDVLSVRGLRSAINAVCQT